MSSARIIPAGATVCVVRADVDAGCVAEFDAWADGHVQAVLQAPGFTGAQILHQAPAAADATPAASVSRLVIYRLASPADWQRFEHTTGEDLRGEALRRFGAGVRFSRALFDHAAYLDPHLGTLGRCKNCDAVLQGACCASCGQKADVHVPTTGELAHEVLEGFTHSDSRLWRTLRLLWFRPGTLTTEFIAGRREAYLPPIRLYLVVSVLCYLILAWAHPLHSLQELNGAHSRVTFQCDQFDAPLWGRGAWAERMRRGCEDAARDSTELTHLALSAFPKAMFLVLPAIAFVHMLLYWRPRRRYAEHLVFFVHLHAFLFSVLALKGLADLLIGLWPPARIAGSLLTAAVCLWMPAYTVAAMKRVFGRSWAGTLARGAALACMYLILLVCTAGGLIFYAMVRL